MEKYAMLEKEMLYYFGRYLCAKERARTYARLAFFGAMMTVIAIWQFVSMKALLPSPNSVMMKILIGGIVLASPVVIGIGIGWLTYYVFVKDEHVNELYDEYFKRNRLLKSIRKQEES